MQESIGYSKDRGDSVNVVNAAFVTEKTPVTDVPLWKQPELVDAARSYAWPVAALVFAFIIMQSLIKPALKAAQGPALVQAGAQLNAVEAETPERPDLLAPPPPPKPVEVTEEQLRLEDARALTRANPVAVANIVKTWVNGEPVA